MADVSVMSVDVTLGLTVAVATDILSGNYESYSVSGTCSPSGGNVSVKVGSMAAMGVSCTSGTWTREDIDTSSDITSNGPVTITVTQVVNSNNLTASVDVQRCVSSGDGTSASSPKLICSYEELKTVMKSITDYDYVALDIDIDAGPSWSEGDESCESMTGLISLQQTHAPDGLRWCRLFRMMVFLTVGDTLLKPLYALFQSLFGFVWYFKYKKNLKPSF